MPGRTRQSKASVVRPAIAALGVVFLTAGAAIWLHDSSTATDRGSPPVRSGATSTPGPDTTTASTARCHDRVPPFRPSTVAIGGVGRSIPVVATPRDSRGVPGVLPLNDAGKHELAWDAGGVRPGDARGHVLMNAHTWPNGSALGNSLLRQLQPGDLIVVRSAQGLRQCYRVGQRLEVPFPDTPPHVVARYYATSGEPQLALIACSGRRTGPGQWDHRTLWFARPVT